MARLNGKKWGVFLACWLMLLTSSAHACGPYFAAPVFTFSKRPENFADFSQGRIGIIQPTWYRSVLTIAYRAINGLPLTAAEQQAAVRNWQAEFEQNDANDKARVEAIDGWLAARRQVLVDEQKPDIQVFRSNDGSYEAFLNCPADAFVNAAKALAARLTAYQNSADVQAWLQAQDQVFSNCSVGNAVPAEAAADATDWLKYDRDYQIAAAHFYAMHYDDAKARFQKIAQTANSPWRLLAKYLLARVAIRQGQLDDAKTQLNALLADKELALFHASAARLLNFIKYRRQPEQLHKELAAKLVQASGDTNFFQDLMDYRNLLDKAEVYEGVDAADVKARQDRFRQDSELTDWIFTLQSTTPDAYSHALARWRLAKNPAWLVASLVKAADADELIAAGSSIPKNSAAFPSAAYHVARLQIARGKTDAARKFLDGVLGDDQLPINQSSHNQLFALRLRLAQNLDEFVHYAQRQARDFTAESECFLEDFSRPVQGEDYLKNERLWRERSMFDIDATRILNMYTPLSKLKAIALHPAWPDYLKRRLVMSIWMRAVLLDDDALAMEFAPLVGQYLPELKLGMAAYANAKTTRDRHFEAIWLMLKNPGLKPVVETANGRLSAFDAIDNYRDNWWCDADFGGQAFTGKPQASEPLPSQTFLTEAEMARAADENAKSATLTGGANYLAAQTLAWAGQQADDRRLPEALHLAVRATRYGCQNCATGKASKAVFDTLHKRFKNNPWQKKTPYWFDSDCPETP